MFQKFRSSKSELRRSGGFTLIELLIVVAIIAILGAVALPTYQRYVMRSRRIDARGALLELASRQESFFAMNNRFSQVASDLGYPNLPWNVVSSGGTSYYQLSISVDPTGQTYTGSATPLGGQAQDTECAVYLIDQTGNKTNQLGNRQPLNSNSCW